MAHSHASLIANLALDAASLGYEDADIRFAVTMASHVYTDELVRDYFARMFPREWPSAEVQAARDAEERAEEAAKKAAKKAAKRRRYRANRAAARKAALEGNTAFVYAAAEAPQLVQQEVEAQPDAEEAHSVVSPDEADLLLRSILRMAIEEGEDDCDCDCGHCSDSADEEEEEAHEMRQHPSAPDAEVPAAPARQSLPDVQKLSYKDATTQSSVVRLKDGRVMEVRRGELTGSNIPNRRFWDSAEAWRDSLPDPNAVFDEDGVYESHEARQRPSVADAESAAQELKEAEAKAAYRKSTADRMRAFLLAIKEKERAAAKGEVGYD
jgi:hypothetical protein